MGKILEGLERAMGFKKFRADREAAMGDKPAKPIAQEKPANTVHLSEEDAEAAGKLADEGYPVDQEQDENEDRKVA